MRIYVNEFGHTIIDFEKDVIYVHEEVGQLSSVFLKPGVGMANGIFVREKSDSFIGKSEEEVLDPIEDRFEILDF